MPTIFRQIVDNSGPSLDKDDPDGIIDHMETLTTRQLMDVLKLSRQGVHLAARACGVKPALPGSRAKAALWRASDVPKLMARNEAGRPRKGAK